MAGTNRDKQPSLTALTPFLSRWASLALAADFSDDSVRSIMTEARQLGRDLPEKRSLIRSKARSYVAIGLERVGREAEALREINAILRGRSIDAFERSAFYLNLASLYGKLGNPAEAIAALRRGIRHSMGHRTSLLIDLLKTLASLAGEVEPRPHLIEAFVVQCHGTMPTNVSPRTFAEAILRHRAHPHPE